MPVAARDDPKRRPLRLIIFRLSQEAANRARNRIRKNARRKGRTPDKNTLLAAEFCILLTTLPADQGTAEEVLSLYRVRWQVEWCIRRWKSVCELKRLPSYPSPIAEVVLKAKLLLILLLHHHLAAMGLPWLQWWKGEIRPPVISILLSSLYNLLREIIRPTIALIRLIQAPHLYTRYLNASKRKRPIQWVEAASHWFFRLYPQETLNAIA